MKKILYIFPHYDDEIFVIPKLKNDIANGCDVKIVFLMDSLERSQESLFFLKKIIGINEVSVSTLRLSSTILDGEIYKYIKEIYQALFDNYKDINEIVTTAYEGGHQDHDTASIVGRALANDFGISLSEFFLYNGHKTLGKFYKVANPFYCNIESKTSYTFNDLINLVCVPFIYKTQWKTMLGLWPFLFLKAIIFPLTLNTLSKKSLKIPKYNEVPMYERWKRITYDDFIKVVKKNTEECETITYLLS